MRFKQKLWLILFICLLLACSGSSGSEFIGEWRGANEYDGRFAILRNGDSLLVDNGKEKIPATLSKDGTLQFPWMSETMILTYSKDTKTIHVKGMEFKRVKE